MSTTTNLALNEPAYNSTSPTWDQPLNYNSTILDSILGNTTSIALTNSNVTLTGPASSGSLGQTQAMRITLTGAISANIIITIPTGIAGRWIVYNTTSGTYTVTIASGGGGTTVTVAQGYNTSIYSDGTNVRYADDGILQGGLLPTLTVTGNTTLGTTGTTTTTVGGKLTLSTTTTQLSALLNNISETATIVSLGASGTIQYYITSQSVLYYTTNSTGNFTLNFAASSGTSLNAALGVGQSVTVAFLNTNGSTSYYNSAITIDGASVTPKWINGSTPSSGYSNSIDVYTYTILKTASATYTVLATLAKFA